MIVISLRYKYIYFHTVCYFVALSVTFTFFGMYTRNIVLIIRGALATPSHSNTIRRATQKEQLGTNFSFITPSSM